MPHLLHAEEIMGCFFIQNFVVLPVVSIFGESIVLGLLGEFGMIGLLGAHSALIAQAG